MGAYFYKSILSVVHVQKTFALFVNNFVMLYQEVLKQTNKFNGDLKAMVLCLVAFLKFYIVVSDQDKNLIINTIMLNYFVLKTDGRILMITLVCICFENQEGNLSRNLVYNIIYFFQNRLLHCTFADLKDTSFSKALHDIKSFIRSKKKTCKVKENDIYRQF